MLSVFMRDGRAVAVAFGYVGGEWQDRNDWYSWGEVARIASDLNAIARDSEHTYMATDAGPHCSPRYDVIVAPRVGDPISYAFNGDCYPCGEIVRISDSMRVIRGSEGDIFYRRKLSGSWVKGGTWSMVHGHVSKRNPSF